MGGISPRSASKARKGDRMATLCRDMEGGARVCFRDLKKVAGGAEDQIGLVKGGWRS